MMAKAKIELRITIYMDSADWDFGRIKMRIFSVERVIDMSKCFYELWQLINDFVATVDDYVWDRGYRWDQMTIGDKLRDDARQIADGEAGELINIKVLGEDVYMRMLSRDVAPLLLECAIC